MAIPEWLQPLADALIAPDAFGFLRQPLPEDPSLRRAAVLILFGEGPDGPDVLLLQRSDDLRSHAGQPAFPGGQLDPDDDGAVGAALREAQEETGVDPSGVEVFAVLPELWVPPSAHAVTPVVAWWRTPSDVGPGDPLEVAAVARVPISALVDPANRLSVRHSSGFLGPAFRVADMLVWGFTAGVLDRLLTLAGWDVGWDHDRVETLPAQAG
ncbi:MAG TPA: CoA pyrophosphatase [Mycobacteriales bacterium]|jgi:8-oxo-dGTP pyrophosphatase MutT (NUDIX family)|nr:CoA pyrophosphatase [Mycobacteriales bacterium]